MEAIVADYFEMLGEELRLEAYSKTTHRRRLAGALNKRSEGSIEFKHQNISAVLIELGYPYISGYKPRGNYQALLFEVVGDRVAAADWLRRLVAEDVSRPATVPTVDDILSRLETPPPPRVRSYGRVSDSVKPPRLRAPVDYLAREASNSSLGRSGEEFALNFERARLIHAGEERLAGRIVHVSATQGDGAGFDILSFEKSGRERYVEVKTTKYGKETPFYVTRNEVEVSGDRGENYHLYRLFDFRRNPRLCSLQGALEHTCTLRPSVYVAEVS